LSFASTSDLLVSITQENRFAIGTGHFAVINLDVIEDHLSEAQELAPDDLDKSLLAELDLFLILYKTVVIQNLDLPEAWSEFVTWAEKYLTSLSLHHVSLQSLLIT
jgi:hypothetical protein